jgi:hypothetical protein
MTLRSSAPDRRPLDGGLCDFRRSLSHRPRRARLWWTGRRERAYREYLDFPAGISGQALTGRAYVQAQKFGARMVIPAEALRLDLPEVLALRLDDGRRVKAQRVVVATGARYRRLNIPNLADFDGAVSGTGLPRSRRACAGTKKSFWSVAAIRPARQRSSCATSAKKSGYWCVGQASQRARRNISSIASA